MQEILDSEAREYCLALIFIAVEENKEKIQSTPAPSLRYGNKTRKVTCPRSLHRAVILKPFTGVA